MSTPTTRSSRSSRRHSPRTGFGSVICAGDYTAAGQAARRQAAWLASPGHTVERVSTAWLTRHGSSALQARCRGYDLLALGAGAGAFTATQHAPIPILIARVCPLGTEVTDTIVVSVDDSPGSTRAVALAAMLAATHHGTVTILPAPRRDPALERAIAASFRVVGQATGTPPRIFGEPRSPEHAIPSAAAALSASLVLVGCGRAEADRTNTARMVDAIGCSVLVVPTPEPI